MNSKNRKILIILGIIVLSVVAFFSYEKKLEPNTENYSPQEINSTISAEESSTPVSSPTVDLKNNLKNRERNEKIASLTSSSQKVVLKIFGNTTQTIESNIEVGDSVESLMLLLRKDGQIDFSGKEYSGLGILIEEINGLRAGGGKNWIYYANGVKPKVGISSYNLKANDLIEWKLETYQNE